MTRKKVVTVRNHLIAVRLDAHELLKLKESAARYKISVSELVRRAALKKRAPHQTTPFFDDLTATLRIDLYHELRRQGINLNQIARHCNETYAPPPPELAGLLREILHLLRQLQPPRPRR